MEPLDDSGNRAELLTSYLEEYEKLERDNEELTKKLSFDAYVKFSYDYHRFHFTNDLLLDIHRELRTLNRKK